MNAIAAPAVAFRLQPQALERAARLFNERSEVRWFGFEGAFEGACVAIRFRELHDGLLGGGGAPAVNGGVISAGFDAAAVMTGLGHYETDTIVTVELAVHFLALARPVPGLAWRAWATRTTRGLAFVQGVLGDGEAAYATATAVVKPA
jgi:acyl-coenzyme A thioesterase PaaI-like protein